MADVVSLLTMLLSALSAGGLALVSVGIVRATRLLDGSAWAEVHRALTRTVGPYLGALVGLSTLGNTLWAVLPGPEPAAHRALAGAAAVLFASVLAISRRVNIPINEEVARWPSEPPAHWRHRRDRWNRFQTARAALSVVALAAVAWAGGGA